MAISAVDGGAFICRQSGWTTTQLAVQKILYLAHMVHLGRHHVPLVHGQFQAWDYGPVHPVLYRRVKAFGAKPIPNVFHGRPDVPEQEANTLREACSELLDKTPAQLVRNTHWPDGAWAACYVPGARNVPIPNSAIIDEYEKRVGRQAA